MFGAKPREIYRVRNVKYICKIKNVNWKVFKRQTELALEEQARTQINIALGIRFIRVPIIVKELSRQNLQHQDQNGELLGYGERAGQHERGYHGPHVQHTKGAYEVSKLDRLNQRLNDGATVLSDWIKRSICLLKS